MRYVELDGLAIGKGMLFCEESSAESGLAVVAKLFISEASEDGGLAHS